MRTQVLLLWMILCALALSAPAQQSQGDSELQLQGSLQLGDDEAGSVSLAYGRFFTERQELGVNVLGFVFGDGNVAGRGGPFYRYNFSTEEIVPYVGGAIQAGFSDSDFGDGALLMFEGGARFFLDRTTAFSVGAQTFYSIDDQDFSDTLTIVFGFSRLWGR
jgi:hypothetical protein